MHTHQTAIAILTKHYFLLYYRNLVQENIASCTHPAHYSKAYNHPNHNLLYNYQIFLNHYLFAIKKYVSTRLGPYNIKIFI